MNGCPVMPEVPLNVWIQIQRVTFCCGMHRAVLLFRVTATFYEKSFEARACLLCNQVVPGPEGSFGVYIPEQSWHRGLELVLAYYSVCPTCVQMPQISVRAEEAIQLHLPKQLRKKRLLH